MTRSLYLLRHADAESASETSRDIDRKLTPRGKKESDFIAAQLIEKSISLDIVLCSTATRVQQTYNRIAPALKAVPVQYLDRLYNPDLETLLKILQHLKDSDNSVLIISHNPTISNLVSYLTEEDIHFLPGVLKYLQLDINSWNDIYGGCAKLVWSISPI